MIVSIHQPDYIPYLGYFYKIAKSDIFVFLDDAQFSSDNIHHWNRIKTSQGEHRLKIPVDYKFGDNINQVRTKDELRWKEKHLKTIEMNYLRAKAFQEIFPQIKELLMAPYKSLADMNVEINQWICTGFNFSTKFLRSTDLKVKTAKEERIIDICQIVGGKQYLSGHGAKAYQVNEHFFERGINLQYTEYQPVVYKQLWENFIPNLSVLDFLFNYNFDWEYVEKVLRGH